MKTRKLLSALAVLSSTAMVLLPADSPANVIISGTRLIYPGQNKEITVKTQNPGATPALVQVWIDDGDPNMRAQDSDAPFVITPPLIRLEGDGGQTFRILYLPGEADLPTDAESVFYFNLLDIPPIPQAGDNSPASYLQLAYRSRLKLFYRPANLPHRPHEAAAMLVWSIVEKNGKAVLQVHNPSAYHVSFKEIVLELGERNDSVQGDMIAPGATRDFAISTPRQPIPSGQATAHVDFSWINDYGALVKQRSQVVAPPASGHAHLSR